MPTASHNIGANQATTNATLTISSFPTGGPLLEQRTANSQDMLDAGGPTAFPARNRGEGRRPATLQSSMHRQTPGMGVGAFDPAQLKAGEGYAPHRPVDKSMTMSDKGPGSFYRVTMPPVDVDAVDNEDLRRAYVEHGAYASSARTDRSALSFGALNDHPRWDPRSSANDPGGAEVRRQKISVEALSSGEVGLHVPGHLFSRKAGTPGNGHRSKLDAMAGPDRVRLLEGGRLGDFDRTAQIHEARKRYRREMRRELHGKKMTLAGRHCAEAVVPGEKYKDHDEHQLMAPSGVRAGRIGIGTIEHRTGNEPRASEQRRDQEAGAWGMWTKPDERHDPIQPSARRNRYLSKAAEMCPHEPGKGHLRSLRPHTVGDLSIKASSQVGQFWSKHSGQWWQSHSHDSHVDEDGEGDGADDDGHGGVVTKEGGVPHWHTYPELFPHEPGHDTQRRTEAHHRDMLAGAIYGSYVSARGPRPSEAADFNEPHGCLLRPSPHEGAHYRPPLGDATDGLPAACKPGASRASMDQVADWVRQAAKDPKAGGFASHDKYTAFHRSAKASALSAAMIHAKSQLAPGQAPTPTVGVTGTQTARQRETRAIVERSTAGKADIGWSHCLRGQKW